MAEYFNCTQCGEYCHESSWNDNDICNGCFESQRQSKRNKELMRRFINNRAIGHELSQWLEDRRKKN